MLSQHLHDRPDHGSDPAALSRSKLESFLARLAYLEANGQLSRYRRNMICRDVRAVLAGIRALGLTRAGQPAAGLAGDVAVERADIPADPERGEPGRDLPPEIMTALCANLHTLEPAEVRVATQIGIDTAAGPRTSSACRWAAWPAIRTAVPYLSMTTSRPAGWAAACRSATPPPK